MFGGYDSPEGLAEAEGVDGYGGFGGEAGGAYSMGRPPPDLDVDIRMIADIMRSIDAKKARVGQPRQGTEMDSLLYGIKHMGPTPEQKAITNILNQNMTPGYFGGEVGYGGYSNFGSDR